MHLQFRQGLVSFQYDLSGPKFLQASSAAGFVDHVVSPKATILNVAHRNANYLINIEEGTPQAWGPIPNVTTYLYWDIDLLTAEVTRGFTVLEPYVGITAPVAPQNGQHWFDLNTTMMKVYRASHSKWSEVIRVFAGVVNGGSTSNITQYGAGTQVGITEDAEVGYITLDAMLHPVRMSDGTFMTGNSGIRLKTTSGTAGTQVQPISALSLVRAETAIPRMTAVYLSGDSLVSPASSNVSSKRPIGLITEDLISGEVGQLVQIGEVTYDGWDFSASIGQALYCNGSGQLTTTRPAGDVVYRLGFVKSPRTIIFQVDAEATASIVGGGSGGSVDVQGIVPVQVSSSVVGPNTTFNVSMPPASILANGYMTAGQVDTLNNHGTRLTAAEATLVTKSDVGHTHPDLADRITTLEDALPGKADVLHNHPELEDRIASVEDGLLNKANVNHEHALVDMTDVFVNAPAFGEVLTYNGANWVNMTPPSGGGGGNLPSPSHQGFVIVDPSMQYNVLSSASLPAIPYIDQFGMAATAPANTPAGWVLTSNGSSVSFAPPSGGGGGSSAPSGSFWLQASGSEAGVKTDGTFKFGDWNDRVDMLVESPDIYWDSGNNAFWLPPVNQAGGVWEVTIKVTMRALNWNDLLMETIIHGTGVRAAYGALDTNVCSDTRHVTVVRIGSTGDQLVDSGDICWTDTHLVKIDNGDFAAISPGMFFQTGQAIQANTCDMVVSIKYVGPTHIGV